jgi:hypothetical protein
MSMILDLNELFGWLGAVAFLTAYFLLSIKVLSSERFLYHLLNAAGGLLMSVSTYSINDRPAFFVNFFWLGIALFSVIRIYFTRREPSG